MPEAEQGGRNVYADLGDPDASEMLVKAQLATKIGEIGKQRGLTQVEAAEIVGMLQPKLSGLLRGQFRPAAGRGGADGGFVGLASVALSIRLR